VFADSTLHTDFLFILGSVLHYGGTAFFSVQLIIFSAAFLALRMHPEFVWPGFMKLR
jgi:hypothetical protein